VCTECKGSGVIQVEDTETLQRNMYKDADCKNCAGTGRLYVYYFSPVVQPMTVDGLKKLCDFSNKVIKLLRDG